MNEEILSQIPVTTAGVVPLSFQDAETKEVLMLAYMNEEALKRTLTSGTTWFYSRSRQAMWNKGETSGHFQMGKKSQLRLRLRYDSGGGAADRSGVSYRKFHLFLPEF